MTRKRGRRLIPPSKGKGKNDSLLMGGKQCGAGLGPHQSQPPTGKKEKSGSLSVNSQGGTEIRGKKILCITRWSEKNGEKKASSGRQLRVPESLLWEINSKGGDRTD